MSLYKLSNKIFGLGLTARELSIYAYLCSLPPISTTTTGAAVITVKQTTIAQNCGIRSTTTVSRAIERLYTLGLVEPLERQKKAHKKGTYIYAVTKQSLHDGYFFAERRVFGQLVPRQLVIYLFMCKAQSAELGHSWNSYKDIAEQTGMKRESVIQTVTELVEMKLLVRIRRRSRDNRHVFVDNIYQIIRFEAGKIRKKIVRLHCKYNRTLGLPDSKTDLQHHQYNRKVRFCQVENRNFFIRDRRFYVRGSPKNAAHIKNPRVLLC